MDLFAKPYYEDYLHKISINGADCRFLDGGGQAIQLDVTGTIQLSWLHNSPNEKIMEFKFPSSDGYHEFQIQYREEHGRWLLCHPRCKKTSDPILIFTHRFVFERDPISLYYQLEDQDQEKDQEEDNHEENQEEQDEEIEEEEEKEQEEGDNIYYDTGACKYTTVAELCEEDLITIGLGQKKKIS